MIRWFGRMKKGAAYHWDLMVVAVINGVLAFFAPIIIVN